MTSQSENDTQTSNNPNVQKPELKEATKPDNSRAGKPPLSQRESNRQMNSCVMRFVVLGCAFVCCVFIGVIVFVAVNFGEFINQAPKIVLDYNNARVGERFYFGSYPQGPNGESKPITWRVLRRDSEGLLVIAEQSLDCRRYNEQDCSITWADCTLRRWLNEEFLKKAFDEHELSLIQTTEMANNAGPSTKDRVFLLSVKEVSCFFADDNDRKCRLTDYAIEHIPDKGDTWWWLRSRGLDNNEAALVFGGKGTTHNCRVNSPGPVRPALQLKYERLSVPVPKIVKKYANAQVGDRFYFGRYPQGANDEIKPITWRVLKRSSNSLLVISEKSLDVKPYNEKLVDVTWSECTLRHWLNEEFINKAFNGQERSLIKTCEIKNNAGTSTKDRIFLLSGDEAKSLFANDDDRRSESTVYAKKSGADTSEHDSTALWWLRSRGNCSDRATLVDTAGELDDRFDVNISNISIRPALRLTLK